VTARPSCNAPCLLRWQEIVLVAAWQPSTLLRVAGSTLRAADVAIVDPHAGLRTAPPPGTPARRSGVWLDSKNSIATRKPGTRSGRRGLSSEQLRREEAGVRELGSEQRSRKPGATTGSRRLATGSSTRKPGTPTTTWMAQRASTGSRRLANGGHAQD